MLVADAEDVVARLAGADAPARLLLEAVESSSHHALRGRDDVAHQVLRALQPTAVVVDGDPRAPRGIGSSASCSWASVTSAGPLGCERDEAGWLRILNDEWTPTTSGPSPWRAGAGPRAGGGGRGWGHPSAALGVRAFRPERPRPLHDGRWGELSARWGTRCVAGTGVRVAGLCRLGSQPSWTCQWDQIGADAGLRPLVEDEWTPGAPSGRAAEEDLLCLGHDLAVFAWGPGWDEAAMHAELDAAALTDEEFLAGPGAW